MHLPACIGFITKDISTYWIKTQYFFVSFYSAIKKIANGESLFGSDYSVVMILAKYAKESWIPLPYSIQLSENKVKDADFCG